MNDNQSRQPMGSHAGACLPAAQSPRLHHITVLSRVTECIGRFFGVLPVSYELRGESIMTHSGSSTRELVRLTDIGTWRIAPYDSRAISIRLRQRDRTIVVGDHRGALRELLERVAGEKKVAG